MATTHITQTTTTAKNQVARQKLLTVVQDRAVRWLSDYSITLLRVSLGLVFLGFGVQKFFPGFSPAETLAQETLSTLSFGILSPEAALLLTAVTETFIGFSMITGLFLRAGVAVLLAALVGIMSPIVLFFGEMFPAPQRAPTLEAQYVLKDLILVGAGLVVAARALGARLVSNTGGSEL